ncbi:MAG: hypothetical protein LBS81_00495 [Endomicrobium sp.]|jgi:cell division protease FtsH|nr:hypothetical protein [Endomicrobium sp.]
MQTNGFLDAALLRPGRFDRKIFISLPDLKEREQLFDFYLKKVKTGSDININNLAKNCI